MKSLSIFFVLLILVAFLSGSTTNAQTSAGYSISGTVIDSATNKPLSYVTVTLKNSENVLVKVAATKDNGTFLFSGLRPATYSLSVVLVGYRTITNSLELTADRQLGNILFSENTSNLKEVSITGQKPIIKQEADRIAYDLQADPDSKGSNVLEMMRKIPYLSVDGDENVMLKGNTNFKVFINGKPSGMLERNLKEVLKSMPASTIQSIEVITNPPSKYDAEGLAGIINIVTTKRIDNGYNGSVNANGRIPVGGPGLGTSLTFRQGKLGISVMGGASLYNDPRRSSGTNRTTSGASGTSLVQTGNRNSDSRSGYGGTELSYELDSLNLISGQFNINGNKSDASASLISQLTGAGTTTEGFNLQNMTNYSWDGFDGALNYQHGFKADKKRLLTFSYRYMEFNNYQNANLKASNRVNYNVPDYKQASTDMSSEQTFQIDYVHPVKKVNIEAGVKAIMRHNGSDYQYLSLNPSTGAYIIDAAKTNTFDYQQNVIAAYNSYRISLKKWSLQAGIRVEHTEVDANFVSTATAVNQNYYSAVPNISASTTFKDNSSLNLNFSQRINRPGINRLNPFVDRSTPGFETTGNPDLKPERINTFSAGYNRSKKVSLNIGLEADQISGITLPVATYDPSTNITRTRRENNGDVTALGTNFNIGYPVTKNLNLGLNGNVMYFWIKGLDKGGIVHRNFLTHYASFSAGYKFEKGWRINGSLSESSRNPTGFQGSTNGVVTTSLGVNKDIIKDKLSFSASMSNPFTKYRYNEQETSGPDFAQIDYKRNYFRSYNASLNYRFGKLKGGLKKSERQIKNDDVAN